MISRPLVAGTVAGWIVGDVEAGLRVGVLFELFALDVLPIGAVRYPDYGPATVAAAALGAGAPWELGLGLSGALGLVLAVLGGWSLQLVRRINARAIQHRAAALAAGESPAIRRLQYGGLARDAARGAALTTLGLLAGWLLANSLQNRPRHGPRPHAGVCRQRALGGRRWRDPELRGGTPGFAGCSAAPWSG